MARYRVSSANSDHVTFEDAAGRLHRARPLHDRFAVGAELHGPRPAPGFAVLSDSATQRLCRVIFEQIDCAAGGDPPVPRLQ
jgi:hypothetical protein